MRENDIKEVVNFMVEVVRRPGSEYYHNLFK